MNETDKLVFNFIKSFGSFESALRITNCVRINKNANIDWDDVKEGLKSNDFTLTDEQKKFKIINHPPKKLRFEEKNNRLYWELGDIDHSDQMIAIDVLVRVRNNLFHGSKHFGDSSESDRNEILISEATVILDEVIKCLKIDKEYNDIFNYWN